jgi:hypothetical protein
MTTTEEMINAIDNARTFMYSLLDPKQTPRVPKSVRKYAKDRLKHFPTKYNTIEIGEKLSRLRAELAALKPQSNADEFASIPLRAWVIEVFQHLCHSPHTPDSWKRDLDEKTQVLLDAIEQGKKGQR